jgi:hypothetical protein
VKLDCDRHVTDIAPGSDIPRTRSVISMSRAVADGIVVAVAVGVVVVVAAGAGAGAGAGAAVAGAAGPGSLSSWVWRDKDG